MSGHGGGRIVVGVSQSLSGLAALRHFGTVSRRQVWANGGRRPRGKTPASVRSKPRQLSHRDGQRAP